MKNRFQGMTSRRIVVVSGHAQVRTLLGALVRGAGYGEVEAADEQELLEQIGRSLCRRRLTGAVDLMLIDACRDGRGAVDAIAQVPEDARPELVVIAEREDEETIAKAHAIGAAVLFAPYDPRTLVYALMDLAPPFEYGLTVRELVQ